MRSRGRGSAFRGRHHGYLRRKRKRQGAGEGLCECAARADTGRSRRAGARRARQQGHGRRISTSKAIRARPAGTTPAGRAGISTPRHNPARMANAPSAPAPCCSSCKRRTTATTALRCALSGANRGAPVSRRSRRRRYPLRPRAPGNVEERVGILESLLHLRLDCGRRARSDRDHRQAHRVPRPGRSARVSGQPFGSGNKAYKGTDSGGESKCCAKSSPSPRPAIERDNRQERGGNRADGRGGAPMRPMNGKAFDADMGARRECANASNDAGGL